MEHENRLLFLKEFTKELIINSKPEDYKKSPIPEKFAKKEIKPATFFIPKIEFKPKEWVSQKINGFDKMNFLIKNPRIASIECPGPDKFVLTRIAGRTSMTQIKLNQNEIQQVIKRFSRATKIPIISGIFKAALGNLVITAVISDMVGSRFIISKMSPGLMVRKTRYQ